ncbi:hypothetical protein GA0115250_13661 [Streptomyces sp. BvitLS-983]|nr:hypothetical protein GA0115250_13661 [Streptomyces sp. BvitLS-983]
MGARRDGQVRHRDGLTRRRSSAASGPGTPRPRTPRARTPLPMRFTHAPAPACIALSMRTGAACGPTGARPTPSGRGGTGARQKGRQAPWWAASLARAAATAASRAAIHSASVNSGMSSVSRSGASGVGRGRQGTGCTPRPLRIGTAGAARGAERPPGAHRAEAAGGRGAPAVFALGEHPHPVHAGVLLAIGPGAGTGVVPPPLLVASALLLRDGRRGGRGPTRAQGLAEPRRDDRADRRGDGGGERAASDHVCDLTGCPPLRQEAGDLHGLVLEHLAGQEERRALSADGLEHVHPRAGQGLPLLPR